MSLTLDVFSEFNAELTDLLTEKLMKISLPLLTRHQQSTLISIIAIVKELKKNSLLNLDDNGIRFTIGFKLFQLSTKQKHLSMRDINWALHSDNKNYYFNQLMIIIIIVLHGKILNKRVWFIGPKQPHLPQLLNKWQEMNLVIVEIQVGKYHCFI